MKQFSLLVLAIITIWGISSCDNAKLEAMKADQSKLVDSLANAKIAEITAQLTEDCDASVEESIKAKVDSVQAAMVSMGAGKTSAGKTTTPKSKPTTTKPTTTTPGERKDLKDRRRGDVDGAGSTTTTPATTTTPGKRKSLKDRRRGDNN